MSEFLQPQFSESQKAAVTAIDKDICVSAGAGSGKTAVLVARFLHLVVEQGIRPERIVAITYTEKAVNHMKQRLVGEFTRRGLHEKRQALENAFISTIHSFAARLLRENPVEAGVDPSFSVLEAGASRILADEILEEVFEKSVSKPAGLDLLVYYGEEAIRESLLGVYGQCRSLGRGLQDVLAGVKEPAPQDLWEALGLSLENFLRTEKTERPLKNFQKNWNAARSLLTVLPEKPAWFDWRRAEVLRQAADEFRNYQGQAGFIGEIEKCFQEALAAEIEIMARPFKESFLSLYELFSARFEERKKEDGFLDFDDLLIKAYQLLNSEDLLCAEVRSRYQRQFDYILVDEFQDTSRLQAQWIDRLTRGRNLFVVGDGKQTIYRFRNADQAAFREKEEAAENSRDGLKIVLSENYRSRPDILNFVNALFKKIWEEDDFIFEPLLPKRSFPEKAMPCVEVLCIAQQDEEGKDSLSETRVREARTLARRVKQLVEGKQLKMTGRDGTLRDVTYGDIAILFRVMTQVRIYEKELREMDVPYYVVRGRGFYEKQEIGDLVNFLSLLENPNRDIPLAAVLRSPLVGLSDDALFWLAAPKRLDGKIPLAQGIENQEAWERLREDDQNKLKTFLDLCGFLREAKDKMKISEILNALLDRTQYDIILLGKPEGKRKHANVRKLIDVAREFERQKAFGLADFIRYTENLLIHEVEESEAQVDMETDDTVKLMTIHKAKGLEFPVVVAADLGGRPAGQENSRFNFSEEYGLGIGLKNGETKQWMPDYAFMKSKETGRRKETEELKRLFYVALTRAEEHLILSGSSLLKPLEGTEGKSYRDLSTWMEWLRKALSFEGAGDSKPLFFEGVPWALIEESEPEEKNGKKMFSLASESPFKAALDKRIPVDENHQTASEVQRLYGQVLPLRKEYYETRDLSVSALMKYAECPGCFFEIYEMGVPDESSEEKESWLDTENREPTLSRRNFGVLFHRVLQHLDFRAPQEKEILRCLNNTPLPLASGDRLELENSLRQFLDGEWGSLLRDKKADIYREMPFIYRVPRGEIRGQIDLLCRTRSGELLVLDYKTGRVLEGEELALKAETYQFQILIYGLAVWEITGFSPSRGSLYFTALNQSVHTAFTREALEQGREKIQTMVERIALKKEPFSHRPQCRFMLEKRFCLSGKEG